MPLNKIMPIPKTILEAKGLSGVLFHIKGLAPLYITDRILSIHIYASNMDDINFIADYLKVCLMY